MTNSVNPEEMAHLDLQFAKVPILDCKDERVKHIFVYSLVENMPVH